MPFPVVAFFLIESIIVLSILRLQKVPNSIQFNYSEFAARDFTAHEYHFTDQYIRIHGLESRLAFRKYANMFPRLFVIPVNYYHLHFRLPYGSSIIELMPLYILE